MATNAQRLTDEGLIDESLKKLPPKYHKVIDALTPNEVDELISLNRHLKSLGITVDALGQGGKAQNVVIL